MLSIKAKARQILELAEEIEKEAINNLVKEDDFTNKEISYNDLHNYLIGMINWTFQCQNKFKNRTFFSPKEYAKEFCTVKYALPRQSGHTTVALKLFYKFFKNPIFLTTNIEMLHNLGLSHEKEPNVGTMYHVKNHKFSGGLYDAVIVDCASFLSKNDIETLYDFLSLQAHNQKNFIFLFLE